VLLACLAPENLDAGFMLLETAYIDGKQINKKLVDLQT